MNKLKAVLAEQLLDLKVNEMSPCETKMDSVYLDRAEKDNSKWLEFFNKLV